MTSQSIWVLARQYFERIDPVAFELLARARQLTFSLECQGRFSKPIFQRLSVLQVPCLMVDAGETPAFPGGFGEMPAFPGHPQVVAVVLGPALANEELQRLIEQGADVVLAIESPELIDFSADRFAHALKAVVEEHRPDIFLAAADSFGRTLMPYLAMQLKTGLTADCTCLEIDETTGLLLQTRPAIGGNIMATIQCRSARPQMATVRPHSCRPLTPDNLRQGKIIRLAASLPNTKSQTKVLSYLPDSSDTSLANAEKIVVVGRGIKCPENLERIYPFVRAMGAVLGATREVVDRGWLDYSYQIGLSGRTVAPKLYIGLGVSGAIQHLAGMQTAETIVAVNRDPDAPLFKVADFGIVGDLFELLPELVQRFGGGITSIPDSPFLRNGAKLRYPRRRSPETSFIPNHYQRVTSEVIAELIEIVGEKNVVYQDSEKLEPFSHDEIPGTSYRSMPEAVVRPANTAEVAAIVRLANQKRIPLTPRGAGSGLSGGAVPVYGGIVIGSDRLNRILEFDAANMMITVEPGVVTNDINEYLRDTGLFYAGYPMSMETCFIGGNVAENAGGGKAVKYGVTSRYVLGLEVVMPTGTIVELGGKLLKDVTGYNLIPLMVGSEGTLGFFTKIILKLIPRPPYQVDLLCLFPSSQSAIESVSKILTNSGISPTSLEFIDRSAFSQACLWLNESLSLSQCGAMLLVTLDAFEQKLLEKDQETLGLFCQQCGATDIYIADNPSTSERIWKIRRAIPESFSAAYKRQSGEDVVVPPAAIPIVVNAFEELAERYGIRIPCYGHAGDGNLHARLCAPSQWSEQCWVETLPVLLREFYAVVQSVGGRISGEHGIGHKRIDYMTCVVSEEYLDLLRALKKAWDPNNIMNPGKICRIT